MSDFTIARNSPFLRFFLWIWETDPGRINICKLFWGTLFFPLGLVTGWGFIVRRRKLTEHERRFRQWQKEHNLATVTKLGSALGDWLIRVQDRLFEPALERFDRTKTAQRLVGFFDVAEGYLRSTKRRFCPIVRVV